MNTALSQIRIVIAEPMRFKARLAIGEEAYASLKRVKQVREYWDLVGAAAGGAALAKTGLAALGAAATPVGWVVVAALASGGAWYGLQKALGEASSSRVDVIPKCINTPIDVLGLSLFDLIAPLALKLAAIDTPDGQPLPWQRERIAQHFTQDWGYDGDFVQLGLSHLGERMARVTLREVATTLAQFQHQSPDCNHEAMSRETVAFLRSLVDGGQGPSPQAQAALSEIETLFREHGRSEWAHTMLTLGQQAREQARHGAEQVGSVLAGVAAQVATQVGEASRVAAAQVQAKAEALRQNEALLQARNRALDATEAAVKAVAQGAAEAGQSLGQRLSRSVRQAARQIALRSRGKR